MTSSTCFICKQIIEGCYNEKLMHLQSHSNADVQKFIDVENG
jgi:hypothetical protein